MLGSALSEVLDALDFLDDHGLITRDTPNVGDGRAYVWNEARDKLQLDAAYFHGNVPAVYFKELNAADEEYLTHLHRRLWNHNRAPLLIAVMPNEVRVYNCFTPPERASGHLLPPDPAILKLALEQVTDILALRSELSGYRRREIVSGRFAQEQEGGFRREQRVDQRLLDNLKHVRRRLLNANLSEHVVNSLLGRSIFVRYLEDREVMDERYYARYGSGRSFHDLLQTSLDATYQLFDDLADRFNGDLFPISPMERREVEPHHLRLLGHFLRGDDVTSGQMYFWAYDFKFIPIEVISAIYETFLNEDRRRNSAYYTPAEIVDFVLNELMPFRRDTPAMRILDPACGSGIFLVEAYRRIVAQYRHARGNAHPTFDELRDLLTASIHGVDLSGEAVQVAAFSCYLALLDFLEPKSIWEDVRFPKLVGTNLFVSDFFDADVGFAGRSFDIIVGNPPWQSTLTSSAGRYVKRRGVPIGTKQIAQAFLWRAPAFLAEDGRICLLAPSKGVLFNQSAPYREFRRQFFRRNDVTKVVDFSAFRRSLFRRAVAPMVAIFYGKTDDESPEHSELLYLNPHPSPLSDGLAGVVVFGDEIRRLSRAEVADHPYIWKVALWGTPRDLALIGDLSERFPSLGHVVAAHNWKIGEGVTVTGEDENHAPELATLRYVPADAVEPFRVSSAPTERIGGQVFHRPGNRVLYEGPHILARAGVLAGGTLASAFVRHDAVFTDKIIGIAGPSDDVEHLQIACGFMNSSLARYYHFLTASQWGVERPALLLMELKRFPCALPVKDRGLHRDIVKLVDEIQKRGTDWAWQPDLDQLVYHAYGMTSAEQTTISDLLTTVVDRFYRGSKASAFSPPSTDDLSEYAKAFAEVFENTTGGTRFLVPSVFQGTAPYRAVSFHLSQVSSQYRPSITVSDPELEQLLHKLEDIAVEGHAESLYYRRNIKVFEPDAIHMVKPAEKRFWSPSIAYNDADETIGELVRTMSADSDL